MAVVLSEDFSQIFPVMANGTEADDIGECLESSRFWQHVKTINVKTNIRADLSNKRMSEEFPIKLFFLVEGGAPVEKEGCLNLSSISTPGVVWQINTH